MMARPFTPVKDFDLLCQRYKDGESVEALAPSGEVSTCILRRRFIDAGIMRGRTEAVKLAFASGKMDNRKSRKGVPQSEEGKRKQSAAMLKRADLFARGWRVTSNGYHEYTRGPNAGRSFHVVLMEERIGRRLLPDEVVHHIDGNRQNNDISNLALMTATAHNRLHRREDKLAGRERLRNNQGQYTGVIECRS
jgi:hypothetical protein